MKFSIATASALLFTAIATVNADEYASAMKQWCGGLSVPTPDGNAVFVAGSNAHISVHNQPNDSHQKTITGLDLYSVASDGSAKYVQNVWKGSQPLTTDASIDDQIPSNTAAGQYYYRVWVTNQVNGMHGPDCLQTSHTFKVTTASHTNAAGLTEYAENLDDESIYNPKHAKGCFGLTVQYPAKDQVFTEGEHSRIMIKRDSSSQTDELKKVDLYKVVNGQSTLVQNAWEGVEDLGNYFTLKDHIVIPQEHIDPSATYFYRIEATSNKHADAVCDFQSQEFKIQPKN
ncbi:uncharacterized protein BX664DRAFT_277004 [Halteromyces radiatus]|uniref:uncharacterized protein n=1 Tax=Halteromyces radiatus TaxID=101107 RepID=UPI002220A45E|nr:uncharacterized protein BX664DRAFT_277004 [Halteromyces radiatus]KAI8092623.1 hypothetical protein BX664DRAFT_277004 [Halteromyces radiatus]